VFHARDPGVLFDGVMAHAPLRIQAIDLDTPDPDAIATFWAEALGWRRTFEHADEVVLEPPAGSPEDGVAPDLVFLRVPEGKAVKNRLHLDLRPLDQAAEVRRLEGLGATRADVGQDAADPDWVVLRDPDGNEFCVLRALTPEERASLPG
jgi:catechol 2,3-dioxygenase-like lactoylglutathione lyase family enzyme